MATRKENFYAYYKANPDKLGGRTIDEAYAAMRRNVVATRNKVGKANPNDPLIGAVERRLAKATSNARNEKKRQVVGANTVDGLVAGPKSRARIDAALVSGKTQKPTANKVAIAARLAAMQNKETAADRRKKIKYSQSRTA